MRAPSLPLVQTAAYYLAFVALGLTVASLGPTLPGLAAQTGSTLRDVSFLFAARAFGYLLGSYVGGRGYDRFAGHPLMFLMLALMALMLGLAPLTLWLPLLSSVMFVLGAGEGAIDVGGNTLLVWAQRDRVGPYLNGLHFCFGVGAFLAPLLVAWALTLGGGIHDVYWLLALLLLPSALWLLRVRGPSGGNPQGSRAEVPNAASNGPSGGNPQGSRAEVSNAESIGPAAPHSEQPGSALNVNRPLLALVVLFFFVYTAAEGGFGGWVYSYALGMHISDETSAAYLTSGFWGALTIGRLLAIPLALKLRPSTIISADLAGCLLSLGVMLAGANSLALTWAATCGLGLCMASIFPTTLALAGQRMTITGNVTGWFFVGASAGNMFLPWLIGQVFESWGPQVVPLLLGADLVAACMLFGTVLLGSRRAVLNPAAGL